MEREARRRKILERETRRRKILERLARIFGERKHAGGKKLARGFRHTGGNIWEGAQKKILER